MSTEEYIRELKRMNSLRSDTIHKGQFLTIVYYK
jgi:LysM repeat protein